MNRLVGTDEHNGVPSQPRADVSPPPHWRLDAIAALGRPHDMVASADGASVAFVLDSDDASDIWAMSVDGTRLRRLTTDRSPYAYWEDTAPSWSPDGERVAYANAGWVYVVPAAGGVPRRVVEGGSPRWLDDRRLLISVHRDRVSRLCVCDADDPWPVAVTPVDGSVWGVAISPDGSRIAYVHSPVDDRTRTDLRVLEVSGGITTTVVSTPGFMTTSPSFSPDGRLIVFASERTGWSELYLLDEAGERRLTHAESNFSAPQWRPTGQSMIAVRTKAGVGDLVEVAVAGGEVAELAGGGAWSNPQLTSSGGVIAIFEDHRTAPQIIEVPSEGVATPRFASIPAAVLAAPHVTPEAVSYPSSDGLEIPAFLFRPPAAAEGPRPVVVYPHGGPTSHYGDDWDGHAQYFLDKGYGWLAINFRGSTSYGLEFEHGDHGTWGVADTEDCLAAHDYLSSLDWVDSERIAIFGASYGSYMAVAALARDPRHRFACGVAKYGDCDILTSWAQGDQGGVEDLERMMGHPSDHRAEYHAGSPIHWVDQIERPLLIAHGELDERVSPKQSQELVDALRKHGKDFEFVTYPTEGHGLLRKAPQIHFYQRLERFLDWYLM